MALVLALVIVFVTGGQDPRPQPRDPVRKPAGPPATAAISGRVVDAETGRPVADALILAAAPSGQLLQRFQAVTDPQGRYQLAGITPGEYVLAANPHQYRATHRTAVFGMAEATAAALLAAPRVVVSAGEARTGIDIRMPRALAIEGRVSGSAGEPLSGITIRAESLGGRVALRDVTTDDRGLYRLYGLSPGSYRVCAEVSGVTRQPAIGEPAFEKTCHSAGYPDTRREEVVVGERDVAGIDIQMSPIASATAAAASSGSATLAGRITEAISGLPLAGALVVVRPFDRNDAVLTTTTDSDGRYQAGGLTAGVWTVRAMAGRHRASHVSKGYSRADPHVVASGVKLADGERRADIDIALPRAGTLSGRVVDDAGEPVAGIRLHLYRAPGGRADFQASGSSDDRGEFRLFGIEPGRYFLCAEPMRIIMSRSADAGLRRRMPSRTCHPSVTDGQFGHPITVLSGDVGGVEVRTPFLRMRHVTGIVRSADGSPARGARVVARPVAAGGSVGIEAPPADALGGFTFSELASGRYQLTVRWGAPGPAGGDEWVAQDIDISNDDAEGVVLQLAPPAVVRGRIVYAGEQPQDTARPGVVLQTALPMSFPSHSFKAPVSEDLTFEIRGRVGPQVVAVDGLPAGWVVERIMYRGVDIHGVPTTLGSGPDAIEIAVGNRPAVVSGRVLDAERQPVREAVVLAVPADRTVLPGRHAWTIGLSQADGTFVLPAVRAGDYLIVALTQRDFNDLAEEPPAGLLPLLGERIVLRESERRTVELIK